MKKLTRCLSLLVALFVLLGFVKNIDPLTVRELLEKAKTLDKTEVTFQGEVIGQKLVEGSHVWVNVLDKEGNAIGFYMTIDQSQNITHYGNNKMSGDILLLTGTFFKACLLHGGDTDIHLTSFEVMALGKERSPAPINSVFLLAIPILTSLSFYFFYKKRKNDSCRLNER